MTAFVRLTSRRALPEIATLFPVTSIVSNATTTTQLSISQRRRARDLTKSRSLRFYATNAKSAGKNDASALKKEKTSVSIVKDNSAARELKLPFALNNLFSEKEVVEEDSPVSVSMGGEDLHKDIFKAPTLEELFSTVKSRRLHSSHYVHLVGKVTKLLQAVQDSNSPNSFNKLCVNNSEHYFFRLIEVDSKVTDLKSGKVIAITRNLIIQADLVPQLWEKENFVKILESFENECAWRFRETELKEVVNVLLSYGAGAGPRTSQNCLREAAIGQLELRWNELDVKMISDILHKLKDPPETLQRHMETRILDLVESMSFKQLVNFLGIFSQSGRTNIQLVKTLSYHLSKNEEVLNFEQISKVAFHLANASFLSYPLMEKLCRDLKRSEFGTAPSLVDDFQLSSLIVSFGKLRWRDPAVLEDLCNILSAKCNAQDCDVKRLNPALQSAIKTLSYLSYSPGVLPQLKPRLLSSIDVESKPNFLTQIDNVSSLSHLGLVTKDRVEGLISAFDPEKASSIPKASLTKLLQINSNAMVNSLRTRPLRVPPLPQLSPPALPPAISTDNKNLSKDKVDELGRMKRFRTEFKQFFPAGQVKTDSSTKYLIDGPWLHPSGHIVDIVIVVDRSGNVLPVPDALVKALTLGESTTDLTAEALSISAHLQPDTHAIAVLLLDVFDFTVYSEMPVGEKINASRDLRAFGFKPCLVSLRQFYIETKSRRTEFINKAVSGALEPV